MPTDKIKLRELATMVKERAGRLPPGPYVVERGDKVCGTFAYSIVASTGHTITVLDELDLADQPQGKLDVRAAARLIAGTLTDAERLADKVLAHLDDK